MEEQYFVIGDSEFMFANRKTDMVLTGEKWLQEVLDAAFSSNVEKVYVAKVIKTHIRKVTYVPG